jgi:hypothetical protein
MQPLNVLATFILHSIKKKAQKRMTKIVKMIPDNNNGQDCCKDNASDKSHTSDLGVSPDLSIRSLLDGG